MEVVTMAVQQGLLYTKDHEWVRIEGDTATVGITDYAQEHLGELVFVELPSLGKAVDAHNTLAVVESSKSASDVFAPVAGEVTQVNAELESKPELINQDCYRAGWICKLKTDKKPAGDLMDAKRYEEYLKTL
jgi:glycine cleavage system H protein